jgi:hypothetical protein
VLADGFGELWVAIGGFREGGELAAAEPGHEFLGQSIERISCWESGIVIDQNPFWPPGIAARIASRFLSARMKRLAPARALKPSTGAVPARVSFSKCGSASTSSSRRPYARLIAKTCETAPYFSICMLRDAH